MRGNPQNDATPNLISDLSSCVLGLSNEVYKISVVQGVPEKMGKIRKPKIQGDTYFLPPLYIKLKNGMRIKTPSKILNAGVFNFYVFQSWKV